MVLLFIQPPDLTRKKIQALRKMRDVSDSVNVALDYYLIQWKLVSLNRLAELREVADYILLKNSFFLVPTRLSSGVLKRYTDMVLYLLNRELIDFPTSPFKRVGSKENLEYLRVFMKDHIEGMIPIISGKDDDDCLILLLNLMEEGLPDPVGFDTGAPVCIGVGQIVNMIRWKKIYVNNLGGALKRGLDPEKIHMATMPVLRWTDWKSIVDRIKKMREPVAL